MTNVKLKIAIVIFFGLITQVCYAQEYTLIPDPVFEQFLIDEGFDSEQTLDGQMLTTDAQEVQEIEILDGTGMTDFTGLQDFTSLTMFEMALSSAESIDLSGSPLLQFITIGLNDNLTTINLNGCELLEQAYLDLNALSSLDVTSCVNLNTLWCSDNLIETLDLSNNSILTSLSCARNNISSLDISTNNSIIGLRISNNPDLLFVDARNGNNEMITNFFANDLPSLSCFFVDDAAYSTANWTNIDDPSVFIEEDSECALSVGEEQQTLVTVFPNPTTSYFQIATERPIRNVVLHDNLGRLVKTFDTSQANYIVSDLKSGFYFVTIMNLEGRTVVEKLQVR